MPKVGPSQGGGSGEAESVPAGDYILALVWFKRKQGKTSGKDYLRCQFVICAGKLKGKRFYSTLGLGVDTEGGARRWQILMEACDVKEAFELGASSEGNNAEGDANIRRLFQNQPFKARVKVERSGQYVNNDLEMIHFRRTWTDDDLVAMAEWRDEQKRKEDAQASGGDQDYGSPPDEDEDASWGGTPAPAADDDFGGGAGLDDDIPF